MCKEVQGDKSKGKGRPRTGHKGPKRKQRYNFTLSLTSALDGSGWSTPRPGRFTTGKYPVPIVQEAGWASRPVWTGVKKLSLTGFRFPDRPARSESLYQLSYPGSAQGDLHRSMAYQQESAALMKLWFILRNRAICIIV